MSADILLWLSGLLTQLALGGYVNMWVWLLFHVVIEPWKKLHNEYYTTMQNCSRKLKLQPSYLVRLQVTCFLCIATLITDEENIITLITILTRVNVMR